MLTSLSLWSVGMAFIAQILSYLGNSLLLQSILAIAHQKGSLGLYTLIVFGLSCVGMHAESILGTSAAIYRWTSGGKGSMEGATLVSIFWPLFKNLMLVLASIFGLIHLLLVYSLTKAQLIGFCLILLTLGLVIGSAALAVRFQNQAAKVTIWLSRSVASLRRKSFDPIAARQEAGDGFGVWNILWQGAWHRHMQGAFLDVAFDMLTLYFLFVAAGEWFSPGVLLAGYGLPLLLGRVAFSFQEVWV